MGTLRIFRSAALFLLAMVVLCGVLYTAAVTGLAQLLFPAQADGSIIETSDGSQYSLLIGQSFEDDAHMWGRIENYDVKTFVDAQGQALAWAVPSNISPASSEYADTVAQRVQKIRDADPECGDEPIPSDLVTCSGSGFDPDISPAAAEYQVKRLARTTGKSEDEIRSIISRCTEEPTLGVFGEARVDVVQVNLILDGVLE
jgi:K+-transporting ATPase ATPase C chain